MTTKSEAINFIRHQLKIRELFTKDDRLSAWHVSLYWALFFEWNENRFQNPFFILRSEIMQVSKIGSGNTYTKCLKELDQYGYIQYIPSYNPTRGSRVNLYTFDKGTDKASDKASDKGTGKGGDKGTDKAPVNVLIPFNKHIKHKKDNKQKQTLINFGDNKKIVPSHNSNNQKVISKSELHSTGSFAPITPKISIPPPIDQVTEFFLQKKSTPIESEKFFNHFESNGWLVGGKTKMKNWQAAARNWMLNSEKFNPGIKPPVNDHLHAVQDKDYSIPL